jgi:hypothetical protein
MALKTWIKKTVSDATKPVAAKLAIKAQHALESVIDRMHLAPEAVAKRAAPGTQERSEEPQKSRTSGRKTVATAAPAGKRATAKKPAATQGFKVKRGQKHHHHR